MHIGPNIVEDGLVLYLDAANKKSYPGTGTSWYDLSGNGNTGVLTNGPTFDSTNAGSIVFDGVDDWVNLPASPLNITEYYGTFEVIFNYISNPSPISIFHTEENRDRVIYVDNGIVYGGQYNADENTFILPSGSIEEGINHIVFSYNLSVSFYNMYINGVLTQNITASPTTTVSPFTPSGIGIGRSGELNVPSRVYFNGNIYLFRLYYKVLTPQEILQNYNATKGRYL